jgi:hypothetical protein
MDLKLEELMVELGMLLAAPTSLPVGWKVHFKQQILNK